MDAREPRREVDTEERARREMQDREVRHVGQRLALREAARVRIAPVRPRTEDQILHQVERDVVEQQRRHDLGRTEVRTRQCRDEHPQRAADRAAQDHDRDGERAGQAGRDREPGPRGDDRARVQLTLAADVVEVHAERECGGQAREHQRRRRRERVGEAVPVAEAGSEQLLIDAQRRMAREQQEDRTERERDEHGHDRDDERGAALDLQPPFEMDVEPGDDHGATPAIASPMSSRSAVSASPS